MHAWNRKFLKALSNTKHFLLLDLICLNRNSTHNQVCENTPNNIVVEVNTKSQIIFPFSKITTQNNGKKSSLKRGNREIWRLAVTATILLSLPRCPRHPQVEPLSPPILYECQPSDLPAVTELKDWKKRYKRGRIRRENDREESRRRDNEMEERRRRKNERMIRTEVL